MRIRAVLKRRRIVEFAFGILLIGAYLYVPTLHYAPVRFWVASLPVLLLLIGLFGSAVGLKSLRFLGWVGLTIFLLLSLGMSFPPEEYRLGEPGDDPDSLPRTVSTVVIVARMATGFAITVLVAWLYRRLAFAAEELDRLADLEDRFR